MKKDNIIESVIFLIMWMWCSFTETYLKFKTGYSNLGIIMALSIISAFAIPYFIQNKPKELSVKDGKN